MSLHTRSVTLVALLLGLGPDLRAADEKPARTDVHGDPLPRGAIARLGTSRLQHAGRVHAIAYSPDGKWLASAGADKAIRFWDAENGKPGLTLGNHEHAVHRLAFVPAGKGK